MKKIVTIILSSIALFGHAQTQVVVDSPEYNQRKLAGTLDQVTVVPNPNAVVVENPPLTPTYHEKSGACDCYVEPDSTYILALQPNDDGSSPLINIPFNFCLYGQTYNHIYINNNGNLTFTGPMSSFSSTAFPSTGNAIVAPFWGDVDTRQGLGQVLYKITPTAVYINWENVGYFSIHGDKRNTFQLIITDGSDQVVPDGNVAFCYQDMDWTTGDASSGVNGFGGIPATGGANKGDGVAYFLISRFDHAGNDFDGALGNPDGIDWLDNKSFYFDACNSGNIPPIAEGISACDTFKVCALGDTADISINFLSPEVTQNTTITYTNGGLTSMQQIANISGNTAQLILRVVGNLASVGTWNISVTATDDATPLAGVTTISFVIEIDTTGIGALNPQLTPLGACDTIPVISVLNGPYDTYLWDDFSNNPTSSLGQPQTYGVTVSKNGCYKKVSEYFNIIEPFGIPMDGFFSICPPDTTTLLTLTDSAFYGNVSWGLTNPALDSLNSNYLTQGTYTITVSDSLMFCTVDTTFTIVSAVQPAIFNDTLACNFYIDAFNTISTSGGVWSSLDTNIHFFPSPTVLNPTIHSTLPGTYTITFTDNSCGISLDVNIFFQNWAWTEVPDTNICSGSSYLLTCPTFPQNLSYLWTDGSTGSYMTVTQPGQYSVTVSNQCNSFTENITIGEKVCDIEAPNVMVLNSTTGNNLFTIQYSGVKSFECTIVNRWGNVIKKYNNPATPWDGKTENGKFVEEGVYFYIIKAVLDSGEELERQGFVHVYVD
ncbi:MAG: nidogen-like domain-containing protein [Moraxellaceae bacterium]